MNIEEIRRGFPILKDKIQLSSCSQSALHENVKQAVELYMDSWETDGMDWKLWMEVCEQARIKFAKLINAKPNEVSIVSSVSHAISAVMTSLNPIENKDEIILSDLDFPNIGHVALSQNQYNVHFTGNELEDYKQAINKRTLLTSIPHVSFYNGAITDIKNISNLAHDMNSYVFVDAYQSAGQIDIDVKNLDVDFLTAGLQKYLLGIPGIAFLYVKEEVAEEMVPKITGWFGQENPFLFDGKNVTYAPGAKRFDSGTFPMINGFAANKALELLLDLDVKNIENYLQELSQFTIEYSNHMGLQTVSPLDPAQKGSNTAIKVNHASAIETELKKQDILVSARNDVIRIAPHVYNTKEDIKHTIDKLAQLIK